MTSEQRAAYEHPAQIVEKYGREYLGPQGDGPFAQGYGAGTEQTCANLAPALRAWAEQ